MTINCKRAVFSSVSMSLSFTIDIGSIKYLCHHYRFWEYNIQFKNFFQVLNYDKLKFLVPTFYFFSGNVTGLAQK